jgi:hypothetical protein
VSKGYDITVTWESVPRSPPRLLHESPDGTKTWFTENGWVVTIAGWTVTPALVGDVSHRA